MNYQDATPDLVKEAQRIGIIPGAKLPPWDGTVPRDMPARSSRRFWLIAAALAMAAVIGGVLWALNQFGGKL